MQYSLHGNTIAARVVIEEARVWMRRVLALEPGTGVAWTDA